MNLLNSSKFVSRSLIGAVGLSASAIALLGAPEAAKAVVIKAGMDNLSTPADGTTTLPIDNIGLVALKGNKPVDTKLQRLQDCNLMGVASCTVDLEIIDLDLMSIDPQPIPGIPGMMEHLFIMLNPNEVQDLGTITINDNGTWDAMLPVKAIAKLPDGTVVETFSNTLTGSGTYPINNPFNPTGIFEGPLVTIQPPIGPPITAPEPTHVVVPVPESSATFPLALLGLAGIWGLKKKQSLK